MFEFFKNYNEMLFKFYKVIFLNMLIYCIFLVIYEYIFLIILLIKYVLFIKDYESFINWVLFFGILFCVFVIFVYLISGVLDLYNNVVKLFWV